MHTRRIHVWAAALLILALSITACAHRATPTLTTAEQRIAQSNAAIAAANRSLTESVIASQRSGLLSVEQTAEVLAWTERVAVASKGIAQILQSTDPWPTRALRIRALVAALAPADWMERYASDVQMQAIVTSAQLVVALVNMIAQEAAAVALAPPGPDTPALQASAAAIILLILQLLNALLVALPSAATAVDRIKEILHTDLSTADAMASINAGAVADAEATQTWIATWRKEHGIG